jgi:hypothetical protein
VAGLQGRPRSGRANLKCGSLVSESTPYRAADGSVRRRLRVAFLWKGPEDSRPRRYRESTRLDDNRANRRLWSAKLKEIESEIVAHSFDPIRWFPWSRRATDQSAARVDTIGDFVRQYLQELAGLRERTREEYRFIFEAHVLASKFALVPLAELDDGHIKRLIRELELKHIPGGRQLQASTINKILARVRTMVSVAFERGLIPRERGNPVLLVKNLKKPPRRVEPFTPDELLRIFAATEGQQRTFYITPHLPVYARARRSRSAGIGISISRGNLSSYASSSLTEKSARISRPSDPCATFACSGRPRSRWRRSRCRTRYEVNLFSVTGSGSR